MKLNMKNVPNIFADKVKGIKLVDIIILVVGISAISIFFFLFYRKTSSVIVTVKVGETSIYYAGTSMPVGGIDLSGTKEWYANNFHSGQVEKQGFNNIQATVLDVYSYNKTPTSKNVYLKVKLNTVYNPATNTNTYKGVPVLIGSPIKLNLDNVYVNGIIVNLGDALGGTPRQTITLEAQIIDENQTFLETTGTEDYVANAINIGDEVKDNNGIVLIKVLDKKVLPAKRTVTTSDGKVYAQDYSSRKDVFLTLQISAQKNGDRYFFLDDIPILIDKPIPINLPTISLSPKVIRFISVN